MNKKEKILSDHHRDGKKLIPPLMMMGNLRETSYVQIIVPEIIWIALMNKKYGIRMGTELSLQLYQTASEINSTNFSFGYLSSYEVLTNNDKERIIEKLKERKALEAIQNGLSFFLEAYPNCPLAFLFPSCKSEKQKEGIQSVKEMLIDLYNQTGQSATFMMGAVIYFLGASGRLHLVEGSVLNRLPELKDYPNTEISKMIASMVRASMYAMMNEHFRNFHGKWIKYFWNRGIELEPCLI